MTEEAIEILKEHYIRHNYYDNETISKATITALNLIQKQQEEIEILKRDFEIVDHECSRLEQEDIKKDKQIEQYQNMLATNDMLHVLECEKKDKIIDLIAKKINQAYFEEMEFEEWFETKVMKVQEKADYGYVVPLIKEYFEKKVEEK